jgi:hypothetical protein
MAPNITSAEQYREALRPYAAAIGEIVFHWNRLHDNLSTLFELIIKSPSREIGVAIWFSTDSDFAQRKMLRAAVEKTKELTDAQRADIIWALNRIDESLRHDRNDAIHAPLVFLHMLEGSIRVVPDFRSASPRAKSLWKKANINIRQILDEHAQLAEALGDFIEGAFRFILSPTECAWPDRPKLPHAHQKKNRKG